MHMADGLISPAVGGILWGASAGVAAKSVHSMKKGFHDNKIPLMGVGGAFVFAAQMINFAIPMTGSSGHIGGGLLLAALLGPGPAFIAMGAVLLIQALFFADGGLLAFGCNWFNMGFFTCYMAYPLIYQRLCKTGAGKGRIMAASVLASVAGLQLGAFSVVLETMASGVVQLPFSLFVLFMQPIHLAIGIGEGLITGAVLLFISQARPEILDDSRKEKQPLSYPKIIGILGACALLLGAVVSSFASSLPDGLEWALEKTGISQGGAAGAIKVFLADLQEKVAFLPDYGFKNSSGTDGVVNTGTSLSGVAGGLMVLAAVVAAGIVIKKTRRKSGL